MKNILAAWDQNLVDLKKAGGQIVLPQGKDLDAWKQGTGFMKGWYLQKAGDDGRKILGDMAKYMHP